MSDFNIVIQLETTSVVHVSPSIGPQGIPGPGVPTGGTTAQVLLKNSSTDYDASWSDIGANVNAYSKQQYYTLSTLSINAGNTIDWNWNTQPEAKVSLSNGITYTLNMVSNRQPGVKCLRVYQNATGSGILQFNSGYILDTSINGFTFAGNTFADLYFRDDGTNIVVFGAEYTP